MEIVNNKRFRAPLEEAAVALRRDIWWHLCCRRHRNDGIVTTVWMFIHLFYILHPSSHLISSLIFSIWPEHSSIMVIIEGIHRLQHAHILTQQSLNFLLHHFVVLLAVGWSVDIPSNAICCIRYNCTLWAEACIPAGCCRAECIIIHRIIMYWIPYQL